MESPSVEELRQWSAEVLMGWMDKDTYYAVLSPGYKDTEWNRKYFCSWKADKVGEHAWAPDLYWSPAWQILGVIAAVKKKGVLAYEMAFIEELENIFAQKQGGRWNLLTYVFVMEPIDFLKAAYTAFQNHQELFDPQNF